MRPDWQMRVIEELEALDEKILKLELFIPTQKFAELDEVEQARLTRQLNHMRAYSAVLLERINTFTPEEVIKMPEVQVPITTEPSNANVAREAAETEHTFKIKPPIPNSNPEVN